jgi:hypothetical protein
MEIQYTKFNQWMEEANDVSMKLPWPFIEESKIDLYIAGGDPVFTDEELKSLKEIEELFEKFNGVELNLEIEAEIDLNFANIPSIENIRRYANYLKTRIYNFIEYFKDPIYYDYIHPAAYEFHSHTQKVRMVSPEQTSGGELFDSVFLNDDPISKFIGSVACMFGSLQGIIRYLDEELNKISPVEEAKNIYELTADRHKLMLLKQTGIFEFLSDKYMNPINPLMKLEDFAKLISTIIGAKSKELRSEVGKLKSEISDPKKPKSVQSEKSIREVNSHLVSLGLPI